MSLNLSHSNPEWSLGELSQADLTEVRRLADAAPQGDNDVPITRLAEEMAGEHKSGWVSIENRRAVGVFGKNGCLLGVGCATPGAEGIACEGYISRVYVAPEARGNGLGVAIAEALEAILVGEGCSRAWLYCWSGIPQSVAFWSRRGFVRMGTVACDEGWVLRMIKLLPVSGRQ